MKTLLILRHAKSSWKDPWLADHDRPLNKRGKRDAPRIGALIEDQGLIPDLILSSTAKRARATAEAVANACGYEQEIKFTRDLYHADPEAFLAALGNLSTDPDIVMVVGHNPGLEYLLEDLTGETRRLPTAALVQVALEVDSWQSLTEETDGEMINLWRPREIA
jgi:phosphohistidine phosphatase